MKLNPSISSRWIFFGIVVFLVVGFGWIKRERERNKWVATFRQMQSLATCARSYVIYNEGIKLPIGTQDLFETVMTDSICRDRLKGYQFAPIAYGQDCWGRPISLRYDSQANALQLKSESPSRSIWLHMENIEVKILLK